MDKNQKDLEAKKKKNEQMSWHQKIQKKVVGISKIFNKPNTIVTTPFKI